jgi:hypothetical protein
MQNRNIQHTRLKLSAVNTAISAILLLVVVYILLMSVKQTDDRRDVDFWNIAILAGHAEAVYSNDDITYRWLPPVETYEKKLSQRQAQEDLRDAYVSKLEAKTLALEGIAERQKIIIEKQKIMIDDLSPVPDKDPVEAETRADVPVEKILEDIEEVNGDTPEAVREDIADEPQKKKWYQFWKSSGKRKNRGR